MEKIQNIFVLLCILENFDNDYDDNIDIVMSSCTDKPVSWPYISNFKSGFYLKNLFVDDKDKLVEEIKMYSYDVI